MAWRIGLVDSCGAFPGAIAAMRFERAGTTVTQVEPAPDPSGHGTRIARIIGAGRSDVGFVLAQVFDESGRTAADVVAAAIDWCVASGVDLVHLSLGLAADRPVLADAVGRAVGRGTLLIASVPARGAVPYPAAYAGVIRGTGDARCRPGEVSALDAVTFGGCPSTPEGGGGGASVGAGQVTRELTLATGPCSRDGAIGVLLRRSSWQGPERRGSGSE
jgi:hypothetical protein